MRIIMVCLMLTLAGCEGGSGSGYSSSNEDAAAMLLLGGTAFANGYMQHSRPALTCFNYGSMMTCD